AESALAVGMKHTLAGCWRESPSTKSSMSGLSGSIEKAPPPVATIWPSLRLEPIRFDNSYEGVHLPQSLPRQVLEIAIVFADVLKQLGAGAGLKGHRHRDGPWPRVRLWIVDCDLKVHVAEVAAVE